MAREIIHRTRDRKLTPAEAEHYRKLRELIEADLPAIRELGKRLKALKQRPAEKGRQE